MNHTTFTPSRVQLHAIAIASTAYKLCFELSEMPEFASGKEGGPFKNATKLARSTLAVALHDERCAANVEDSVMRSGEFTEAEILNFIREYKATKPLKLYITINQDTGDPQPFYSRDTPRFHSNTTLFGPFDCEAFSVLHRVVDEFEATSGSVGTLPTGVIDAAREALRMSRLPVKP